jgi:peptidoglycan/LPS O-acetylase OafA/YrhL
MPKRGSHKPCFARHTRHQSGRALIAQPARYPNFDVIRLVAASSVIFSHAFLISEGTDENEPLVRLLGDHNITGIYGVFVFFTISGLLVTKTRFAQRVFCIRMSEFPS